MLQQYQQRIKELEKEIDKLKREMQQFDPKTGLRKIHTREKSDEQTSRD